MKIKQKKTESDLEKTNFYKQFIALEHGPNDSFFKFHFEPAPNQKNTVLDTLKENGGDGQLVYIYRVLDGEASPERLAKLNKEGVVKYELVKINGSSKIAIVENNPYVKITKAPTNNYLGKAFSQLFQTAQSHDKTIALAVSIHSSLVDDKILDIFTGGVTLSVQPFSDKSDAMIVLNPFWRTTTVLRHENKHLFDFNLSPELFFTGLMQPSKKMKVLVDKAIHSRETLTTADEKNLARIKDYMIGKLEADASEATITDYFKIRGFQEKILTGAVLKEFAIGVTELLNISLANFQILKASLYINPLNPNLVWVAIKTAGGATLFIAIFIVGASATAITAFHFIN